MTTNEVDGVPGIRVIRLELIKRNRAWCAANRKLKETKPGGRPHAMAREDEADARAMCRAVRDLASAFLAFYEVEPSAVQAFIAECYAAGESEERHAWLHS